MVHDSAVDASLHFSTRSVAHSKRLPVLRELFDRSIQMEIDTDPGLAVDMQMHIAPGLRRARMLSPLTARAARPAQRLADGEDTVCLMIKTGGRMSLTQGRREGEPQVGEAVLLLYRQPAQLRFVGATYQSVRVPYSALAALTDLESSAARCIRADTQALALLRSYVDSLPERLVDPQLCRLATTHVYDLMALSIGASGEAREIAGRRGLRAARLAAIKAALMNDATLRLDDLATRQGVSARYVQMLFEQDGTTFSEFALARRLEAAHRMLAGVRHAGWSIAEIALEAGFGDLSHFNRCFKRRYRMTPSDLRRHARPSSP